MRCINRTGAAGLFLTTGESDCNCDNEEVKNGLFGNHESERLKINLLFGIVLDRQEL